MKKVFVVILTLITSFVLYSCGESKNEYVIKFETNGGSLIEEIRIEKIEDFKLPNNPTKEGYLFDGWFLDEKLSTKFTTLEGLTKKTTLYAKWKEESSNEENIILNILNQFSSVNYKNFVIRLEDFKISGNNIVEGTVGNGCIEIDNFEISFSVDENNKLIGSGRLYPKINQSNYDGDSIIEVYLYDEILYYQMEHKLNDKTFDREIGKINLREMFFGELDIDIDFIDENGRIDIDKVFNEVMGKIGITSFKTIEEFVQTINKWYDESFSKIIEDSNETNEKNFSELICDYILNMLEVTETEDGFEIRFKKIDLEEKTVYELLVDILGEKILKNIDLVLDYNVDKLIKFIELKGINIEELIKSIESLLQLLYDDTTLTLETFIGVDLLELIKDEEIRKISILDILEDNLGYSAEEIKSSINEYIAKSKDIKIIDLINEILPSEVKDVFSNMNKDFVLKVNKNYVIDKMDYTFALDNININDSEVDISGNFQMAFNEENLFIPTELITEVDNLMAKYKGIDNFGKKVLEEHYEENSGKYTYEYVYDYGKYVYDSEIGAEVILSEKGKRIYEITLDDFINAQTFHAYPVCNGYYFIEYRPLVIVKDNYEVNYEGLLDSEDTSYDIYLQNKYNEVKEEKRYRLQGFRFLFNPETGEYVIGDEEEVYQQNCKFELDLERTILADECMEYDLICYKCTECDNYYFEYGVKKGHQEYITDEGTCLVVKCHKCTEYRVEISYEEHYNIFTSYDTKDYDSEAIGKIVHTQCRCGCTSDVDIYIYNYPYCSRHRNEHGEYFYRDLYSSEKELLKHMIKEIIKEMANGEYIFGEKYYFGYTGTDYKNAKLILEIWGGIEY